VHEYFLPNNLTFSEALRASGQVLPPEAASAGLVYRPVILGQAQARFYNPRYKLDHELYKTVLVASPDRRGLVRWENFARSAVPVDSLDQSPVPAARFAPLGAPFSDIKAMTALGKDFQDWAYRTSQVTVRHNPALKLYAGPEVSAADFRRECAEAARSARDDELRKQTSTLDRKIATLQDRLNRAERDLKEDESELSNRKLEEFGTHAENILNLFGKNRRRLSTSLTKRRMTQQAKDDVESARDTIEELAKQIKELEAERTQIEQEINERWGRLAAEFDEIPVNPMKKDVLLDLFGLAWMPYHLVQVGGETIELPGFA
jgi:chaperonin cofactor prefoldin